MSRRPDPSCPSLSRASFDFIIVPPPSLSRGNEIPLDNRNRLNKHERSFVTIASTASRVISAKDVKFSSRHPFEECSARRLSKDDFLSNWVRSMDPGIGLGWDFEILVRLARIQVLVDSCRLEGIGFLKRRRFWFVCSSLAIRPGERDTRGWINLSQISVAQDKID